MARLLSTILLAALTYAHLDLMPHFGKWGVGTEVRELVDYQRPQNPFEPFREPRRLVVTAFIPRVPETCFSSPVRYMYERTGAEYDRIYEAEYASLGDPKIPFDSIELALCWSDDVPSETFPVVLLSPGLGHSRLIYSFLASSLTSEGFIVVTIDHPYDAAVVEYCNGATIDWCGGPAVYGYDHSAKTKPSEEWIETSLKARQADISFLIDKFEDPEISHSLFEGRAGAEYLNNIQVIGHNLGAAAAAAAMRSDLRIGGGVNLDGAMFGLGPEQSLPRPFMLMTHDEIDMTTASEWRHLQEWHNATTVQLAVQGSGKGDFNDFNFLQRGVELNGETLRTTADDSVQVAPDDRVHRLLARTISDFFKFTLGRAGDPVDGYTLHEFPELHKLEL